MRPRNTRWGFRHYRWQSALAIAALATAVTLPVVLLSVGNGVVSHEAEALSDSGYQIVVSAPGSHGIEGAHVLAAEIQSVPHVAAASPILSDAVDVFPRTGLCAPALAEGVIPVAFQATEGAANAGFFPQPLPLGDPTDMVHYANGTYAGSATWDVLVSSPLAQNCTIAVGSQLTLSLSSNGTDGRVFNVTGTFGVPPSALGPAAAFAVLTPLSDLQVLAGLGRASTGGIADAADSVEVGLLAPDSTNPTTIQNVAQDIQSQFVPYYGVTTLTQQASQARSGTAILDGFYLALSSVGLAVGLIFLTLVLVRRVEAQRQELGIRRAVGVPGRRIALEMLGHAVWMAAWATLGGILAGYVIVEALATWGSPTVQTAAHLATFSVATLGALAALVIVLGAAGSLAATRAALRLSIPEALR
ncbi:MAG: ABC transporter permease [Thermoplasmata archaeon]